MAEATEAPPKRGKGRLRAWLRAAHRDAGYLAVGLTVVYALSGIAVNHISDWDPNFRNTSQTHELGGPIEGDDTKAAETVMKKLGLGQTVRDAYRATPDELEITLDKRTLHVNTRTGHVVDEGQEPRFLIRAANWLHLNRGKKAWTLVADTYAATLLLLAISGMFMIPGRKGLVGRGAFLVLAGALIPVAYVSFSGGPGGDGGKTAAPASK